MPSRDELVRDVVKKWVEKAQDDLEAADALVKHGGDLWSIVAFHCQQSAEKFIKALLTSRQIEFGKTHDLTVLVDSLTGLDDPVLKILRSAEDLTVYGVQVRYPGEGPEVDQEEAENALELARRVSEAVLKELKL